MWKLLKAKPKQDDPTAVGNDDSFQHNLDWPHFMRIYLIMACHELTLGTVEDLSISMELHFVADTNTESTAVKKILVLYGTAGGGSKPHKLNWVMHQYHLGTVEEETEGQYVVAKIFYQPQKETEKVDDNRGVNDELDAWICLTSPRTPKTDAPDPPRPGKSISCDDVTTDCVLHSLVQEPGWSMEQQDVPSFNAESKNDMQLPIWEDDSQAVDLAAFDDSLICNENLDSCDLFGNSKLNHGPQYGSNVNTNDASGTSRGASSADLDNLDLGTQPDFNLSDLPFTSQDSSFGWLERI